LSFDDALWGLLSSCIGFSFVDALLGLLLSGWGRSVGGSNFDENANSGFGFGFGDPWSEFTDPSSTELPTLLAGGDEAGLFDKVARESREKVLILKSAAPLRSSLLRSPS